MRDVQNREVPKCGALNPDCLSVSESPGKFLEWMHTEVWGIQAHLFISTYLVMSQKAEAESMFAVHSWNYRHINLDMK